AIVPVGVFTLLATERRAGQIATMIAFLAFALVFLAVHRKAFFLIALPLLIGGAIYLPLFWNNTSMVGQPARAIRSLYQPDERDAASNLYRLLEKINVRATIKSDPLRGVGFGREFLFVVSLPDLSWWPFWHYMPHHNILWVWLKTGAFGFIIFWTLMGTAIAQAAYFARVLRQREARVFALLALAGIISSLVFCWVDLGLVMNRVTVFLGTILGTLAVLDQIE
ncbi:MAG: O-antigen ligase family protein, partial [Chloroflexota bacterium]